MSIFWCDKCNAVVEVTTDGACSLCGFRGDQYENIFDDPRVQALRRDSLSETKIGDDE